MLAISRVFICHAINFQWIARMLLYLIIDKLEAYTKEKLPDYVDTEGAALGLVRLWQEYR